MLIEQGSVITLNNGEKFIVDDILNHNNKKYLYSINQEDILDIEIFELINDVNLVPVDESLFDELLVKFNELNNQTNE